MPETLEFVRGMPAALGRKDNLWWSMMWSTIGLHIRQLATIQRLVSVSHLRFWLEGASIYRT